MPLTGVLRAYILRGLLTLGFSSTPSIPRLHYHTHRLQQSLKHARTTTQSNALSSCVAVPTSPY